MMHYLCVEIRKCSINPLKCITPCIASSQSYNQLAGMLCHVACHHDHVPNHCPQTAPPYLMLCFRSPAAYGFLACHAQYVVRDYGKLQYQLVGVKFAGRKPFQIHIRLYLAVELFTFPMCMVQAYDFMVVQPKVRPPGIGLDVIGEQKLAVLVNRSVDDLIAGADGDGFLLAVFCFVGDALPVASYMLSPLSPLSLNSG